MALLPGPSDEFPVQWKSPADAELSWNNDRMHAPDVMTPLRFDLFFEPFFRGFGADSPVEYRSLLVNYYVYSTQVRDSAADGPQTESSIDEVLEELTQAAAGWRDEIIPEVLRHIDHYRLTDFDALADGELANEVDELNELRVRQGQLHTMAVMPWAQATDLLIDTYLELTGKDEVTGVRLVQGYGSKSVEAGQALWRLSRLAASIPAVREPLLEVTTQTAMDCLRELERSVGARPFLDALSEFLDEYGWRSDLFELSAPTWVEDPTIALCQLRSYLEMEDYEPIEELGRLGEEREAAIRETLGSLDSRGRSRLEAVLKVASDLAPVQEDHNFYIDQRLALMPRRLILAVGRRLTSSGVLNEPEDIFYLHAAEVRAALQGADNSDIDLAIQRKQEMARWAQVAPPPFIGAQPPPQDDSSESKALDRFFGKRHVKGDQPNLLTGNGGSAGVKRGPAQVLLSLAEVDRLRPGDVLVARTTMPPWTPLFAVASAIVVETGGILSHAAVTAREYGIPAVLGVDDATQIIRDGQLLEVDGTKGEVRII